MNDWFRRDLILDISQEEFAKNIFILYINLLESFTKLSNSNSSCIIYTFLKMKYEYFVGKKKHAAQHACTVADSELGGRAPLVRITMCAKLLKLREFWLLHTWHKVGPPWWHIALSRHDQGAASAEHVCPASRTEACASWRFATRAFISTTHAVHPLRR